MCGHRQTQKKTPTSSGYPSAVFLVKLKGGPGKCPLSLGGKRGNPTRAIPLRESHAPDRQPEPGTPSAPSQLLDKHASPNIGSNTSKFNNILEQDLFLYRPSHRRKSQLRLCPAETLHRERSVCLTKTCGCLFEFVCKKKAT